MELWYRLTEKIPVWCVAERRQQPPDKSGRQEERKYVVTKTNARDRQKKERRLGAGKRTRKHEGRIEAGDLPAEKAAE